MENLLLADDFLVIESKGIKLLESHQYWANKRILFNILVGGASTLSLLPFLTSLHLFDLFGILVWGLAANGLYSAGYALESYLIVNSEGMKNTQWLRGALFWVGTISYVFVSVVFSLAYFSTLKPDLD